ncbi:heterokaryon incompatibility protein-domain-containing protein [Podospora didyma]|uniref:Heterokaryon incompatibility protein-domain-containing protein n=1 Tax=Podospora didyma TaxID=330526 RepID=A0AAE0KJD2_9PEZI|nr:heterokaryon incompatibility protein-domain-containing protein [Podospora didyma]
MDLMDTDRVYVSVNKASLTQLDERPRFEALSYVWVDPTIRRPIVADGRVCQVTTSLEAALQRRRHPTQDRQLWVDALCIDQENKAEKSHQVNLMKQIYSKTNSDYDPAERSEDDSRPSTESGEEMSGALSNPEHNGITSSRTQIVKAVAVIRSLADDHHLPSSHGTKEWATFMNALSTLMQLSWWERIWTMQKVVLPVRVTVTCGASPLV